MFSRLWYLARKKVSGMKAGTIAEAEAATVDLGGFSPEEEAQIVKIQAAARGHITRKTHKSGSRPPTAAAIEEVSEAIDLSTFNDEEQAKIVKIQAGWLLRTSAKP
jgi:imidazolonepropionase-like amidohydrolase